MSSINNISKRFALILIDPQNGFVNDGCWSRMFPIGQSTPILETFNRIASFLHSISNPDSIPILISETGFSHYDRQIFEPINNELSQRKFHSITHTFKPHTNLSICPGVQQWLNEQLEAKLDIVIGGCTITSCVRDSSIQMKKKFPQLNFLYMNYALPPIEQCENCLKKDSNQQIISPVQLAYQQMKDAGINIIKNSILINQSL
ncbi:unnamed protein product [Adineta steineri]|uniref:Isochorismatase-like domain-containing protein n=1 Tax=Adineta steineri TaxID=433720 RepID=A0A814B3I6_9BILA|nr:unnamed protein product [Adineta steineri]CAF0923743.1 unnamed protein product [Adineta steineri]CAF1573497.1 unnamed protein product [Adineta steineri]CAF1670132.1 unnamed protein product [Adineta steineri]